MTKTPLSTRSETGPLYRGRLFRKYFALILALVCGTLAVSSAISLYFSYEENKAALAKLQYEKAISAAARIDQFVRQIEQQLSFAGLPQLGAGGSEQRRIEFLKLLRQVPAVTDIVSIGANGLEQLAVSRLSMDLAGGEKDRSQDPAFVGARPGKTYFGRVYFRKETEPYMTIAMRSGGENGNVTVAEVNLKFIWDVVTKMRISEKGKAFVVDNRGQLVADPDIGLVLKKTDLSMLLQVKTALAGTDLETHAMQARDLAGREVISAFAPIEQLGWKVFVEQPVSEVYATLNASIWRAAILLIVGLLFSALAAVLLARSMVRPIRTLQEGAQRIGEGDLAQRIEIHSGDELEALAEQFNRMSGQLAESYAGLEHKVEERTQELSRTLAQQTATAEVLRVISGSITNVQPVFDAIVKSCSVLFGNSQVTLRLVRDGVLVRYAWAGPLSNVADIAAEIPLERASIFATCVLDARLLYVPDLQEAIKEHPLAAMSVAMGYRSALIAPLIADGKAIGGISIDRTMSGAFHEKEISTLLTFADQAVIAIENVRLFNETKEALDQQTAISEILRVISSSPTDVLPVLNAIAERAARLCDAAAASMYLTDGDALRHLASMGPSPDLVAHIDALPIDRGSVSGRALLERKSIQVLDMLTEGAEYPLSFELAERFGHRTVVVMPLYRDGKPFGTILLRRNEVRPFNDREVSLLQTFGDQAAIAIENVRLFKEIQEKSRQLEIANKHKSEFLANMSHELRTPLNAIIGFSEVLLERMFGEMNDKQEDYLKDIHSSGQHLLSLINDILDLAKVEAGQMELHQASFDLPNAVGNALSLIRERALRHGIVVSAELEPQLGELIADERKLKQILLNLLSNAVKFTPEGGKITVGGRRLGEMVEIAVTDTGVGIALADQALVFEEFKQVGTDYTRKAEGTGLGLALTRKFVELHGGTLRVVSELGKGSTFAFTLPLNIALPASVVADK